MIPFVGLYIISLVQGGKMKADEGGSYEVHVEWDKVLPLWFHSLAIMAAPEEYAREAVAAIDDFAHHDRERYPKMTRSAGNREQRAVLEEL